MRFESEARALARLDHPNIVTVMRLDRTEDEQRPFFLMERLRGGTLRDHMNRGAVSARRALATAAQLSRALHYVHARGLLHDERLRGPRGRREQRLLRLPERPRQPFERAVRRARHAPREAS